MKSVWKNRVRQGICIVVIIVLLGSIFGQNTTINAQTDYQIADIEGVTSSLTIDGKVPDSSMVLRGGETIELNLSYSFTNEENYTTEDRFVYDIPSIIKIPETSLSGQLYQGTTATGKYWIENNKLYVQYYEDFLKSSDRTTNFNLKGTINITDENIPGSTETITLPGGIEYKVQIVDNDGLKIEKTGTERVENGHVYIDYTVKVTSVVDSTNVVITDTRNNQVAVDEGTIKTETSGTVSTITRNADTSDTSSSPATTTMNWNCESMSAGSTVTITYTAEVRSGVQNYRYQTDTWTNTATAVSDKNEQVDMSFYGIEDNIIGFLEIPDLDLELPILLGANSENLAKGAAHLTETSYPIGGENTNCVIAAHRGYYQTEMFRNLDKLEIGDVIYIENFRETLTYEE